MTQTQKPIHLIWAVDVLDMESDFHRQQRDFFLHLTHEMKRRYRDRAPHQLRIHPIYVLSGGQIGVASDAATLALGHYLPLARKALKERIQSLGVDLSFFNEGEVLCQSETSLKSTIHLLGVYARSIEADAIVVSSHGRTGIDRLMLGSFAEQLILHADPPVIILGREYQNWKEGRLLFATDLSTASQNALQKIEPLLLALSQSVILYHSLRRPDYLALDPGILLPGGNLLPIEEFMKNERVTSEALLQKWCDQLEKKGIRAIRRVGDAKGDLALEIQEAAHANQATWIALASESGAISTAIFGSVARKLSRNFEGPVWIHKI